MLPQPLCCYTPRPQALHCILVPAFSQNCKRVVALNNSESPFLVKSLHSATAASSIGTQAPSSAQPAQAGEGDNQAQPPTESRYLTYQEYVAQQRQLQEQQQQQEGTQAAAGQRADESAHASTSAPSEDGRRVPWNKGRKHSAMTIARIREGSARALQRPEVKAKLDAWNQSRIGSKMPEDLKARIADKQRATMQARRQSLSEEELAVESARRSALAKRLWQDPEYAARTLSAIQAAGRRRRSESGKAAAADGAGSAPSSKRGSAGATAQGGSSGGKTARRPTKKELAAIAKEQQLHQQQQLQRQVDRMLQTQQLIANTEQTVEQLRSNMAAFANNPQAQATAAAALQQAQSYLQPARQLVEKLQASLDSHGASWDPSTGQLTHVNHQPLTPQPSSPKARSSSSSSSSKAAGSSRKQQANSSKAAGWEVGPDVVRSSRAARRPVDAAAGGWWSAHGDGRSTHGPSVTWTPVPAGDATGQQGSKESVPAGAQHSSLSNGNGRNGHSSSPGGMYVPLHTHSTGEH